MFFVNPISESNEFTDWNFGKMLKNGAPITIGSDWAYHGPEILPGCALILDSVSAALPASTDTRSAAGAAICRMLTAAGAAATGRDSTAGTIAVGKKANFIMIDRDLAKGDFEGAQVLGTWFEGERVFESSGKGGP